MKEAGCLGRSQIDKILSDLFPINRSLTGEGNRETLNYVKGNLLPCAEIKKLKSGTKVFDWVVPPEWTVKDAFVKNKYGNKIIDYKKNNLHLVSYSEAFNGLLSEKELKKHLHTLPDYPDWIPYRTSYYKRAWGFCCSHNLLTNKEFKGPFEVSIETSFDEGGEMIWLEDVKFGKSKEEILISSYFCHPSLANDNLSGFVLAALLFKFLKSIETRYTYRLVIVPETIGALAYLKKSDLTNTVGGMVLSCVGGPGNFSLKEGFNKDHWVNKAAHFALKECSKENYIVYPFDPEGSDERQYSSPAFRIVTPSIHKSKYYEYAEYHTSADNLEFISALSIQDAFDVYRKWIDNLESYCFPRRTMTQGEYQLGKHGLYPEIGGTLNQQAYSHENNEERRKLFFDKEMVLNRKILQKMYWLMHLADGKTSNFDIAEKSGGNLDDVNRAIAIMLQKKLVELDI